jgi:hypothetical protein
MRLLKQQGKRRKALSNERGVHTRLFGQEARGNGRRWPLRQPATGSINKTPATT